MVDTLESRRELALAQLKERILVKARESGDHDTAVDGFMLSRRNLTNQPDNCFYIPLVSVTVQGFKRSIIGSEEYRYGEGHCLIAGVDIPSVNFVTVASEEHPFLAATLFLDRQLITQLMPDLPPARNADETDCRGMLVTEADPYVLDAFLRLTELLDAPDQISVLAPMIIREIHFRLLTGPHGGRLRALNTVGSQSNQVARAISWLRENYKDPLLVENLAKMVNMAPSTFHRHFKEITTLSPLQYQKRLRLYEAQRLMLLDKMDAAEAGLAVGYESPTQFSREYKRQFGDPPHRDVSRLRRETKE